MERTAAVDRADDRDGSRLPEQRHSIHIRQHLQDASRRLQPSSLNPGEVRYVQAGLRFPVDLRPTSRLRRDMGHPELGLAIDWVPPIWQLHRQMWEECHCNFTQHSNANGAFHPLLRDGRDTRIFCPTTTGCPISAQQMWEGCHYNSAMPSDLKRYQHEGEDHFLTFSCYQRRPYLANAIARDTFLDSLEQTRARYEFEVLGYVVMPEHVHLLLSEPADHAQPLSKAIQALKISVSRRLRQRPFWHRRYYDFNVYSHDKRVEKLRYMHRNPVTRGLVARPEDWGASSFRFYLTGEAGPMRITKF